MWSLFLSECISKPQSVQLSSVQLTGAIYELRKAHIRSNASLRRFPNDAFGAAAILA